MPLMRVIAALVLASGVAQAFQPAPPTDATQAESLRHTTETIEVSIVNVDAVVTDKKGHRIAGLTKDDFVIVDDGKPQTISNFSEYRDVPQTTVANADVGVNAPVETAPAIRRALVVWIDDVRLPNFKKDPVFAALKKTLYDTVRAGDLVTVIHWRLRPAIEQQYTSDIALVDAALDRISGKSSGVAPDLAMQAEEQQARVIAAIKEQAAGSGLSAEIDPDDEIAMLDIRSAAEMALWEMKQKVAAMSAIMASMPLRSKCAMVILSNRLGALAGGDFLLIGAEHGPVNPEDRMRFGTTKLMKTLTDTANSHGVTIYPMFAEGLQTPAFSDRSTRSYYNQVTLNETSSLDNIADQTGGKMAWSAVEVAKTLPLIRDDFTSYYSLAYRTPSRFDDKARKLVVKMKNPAYVVRARRELVERNAATEMHDRIVASLFEPTPLSRIALDLEVGLPVKKGRATYSVPIQVRIPAKTLMTISDGVKQKGAFTVFVTSARTVGVGSDVTHQTIPFSAEQIPADGTFIYDFQLLTDFLTTRVSVAVLDEVSGEIGFVRAEMPRAAR